MRTITKRFWGTVFTLIIAIAVIVQLGRQAFPLLQDYKYEIIGFFGKELGLVVEVESLQADWSGLRPKLELSKVLLKSRAGETVFKIDQASIELSIISSVLNRRFSWRQILFDGFETHIVQGETGRWAIPGLPEFTQDPTRPSRFSFDDPYDLFLIGRRIHISEAKFTLEYLNGESSSIFVPDISIENDFDFRRIIASADVGDGEETMSLVIEGDGDPRRSNFIANGYFELNSFPTKSVLKTLAISDDIITAEGHRSSLRLWFQSDAAKGLVLRGDLAAEGEMKIADGSFLAPQKVTTQFVGTLDADRGWDLSLKDLNVQWQDRTAPAISLRLVGDLLGLKGLAVAEVDVEKWSELALYIGLKNNPAVNKYLSGINPRGLLKNVNLALTDKEQGYFSLSARVENGRSDAIMGAPAIRNIHGYLQTSLTRGRFDIEVEDGLTVDLPKVYEQALEFDKAQGQLRWSIDLAKQHFYISSSLITLETAHEKGKGYVHLSLPFKKELGNQAMTLTLGVEQTDALRHRVYVPATVPEDLSAWMGQSIKGGQVRNVEFIYHGSVEPDPDLSPSLQLLGSVQDATLAYAPDWPQLTRLNASLALDNDSLNIRVDSASILGNAVQSATIDLLRDPVKGGPALAISADLQGEASSAMNLLNKSPIKEVIGTTFDTWEISGGLSASAKLMVPIDPQSPGHSQRIDVNFAKARAVIPELNITLSSISGKLHYDSDKGIYSERLKAKVWGEKFSGKISAPTNPDGGKDTLIAFSGSVDIDDLYKWTKRPELKFTQGKTKVGGKLFIPAGTSKRPLEAVIDSDLAGISINLPAPLTKTDDEVANFSTRIRLYPEGDEYQFLLADKLKVTLLIDEDEPVSGIVEVNEFRRREDTYSPIPKTERFDVSGYFDSFDLEQWIATKNQYFAYEAAAETSLATEESTADAPLKVSYDFFMNTFLVGSFGIDKLSVRGKREDTRWLMDVNSELLSGAVTVAEDERPIIMDLEYVRLDDTPKGEIPDTGVSSLAQTAKALDVAAGDRVTITDASDSEKVDDGRIGATQAIQEAQEIQAPPALDSSSVADSGGVENLPPGESSPDAKPAGLDVPAPLPEPESMLAGVDLSAAVAIDFSTKEFSVGETDYGSWAFKLRPIDGGIMAQEIFATTKKMTVGEDGAGAEFIWLKDGETHSSQFQGVLQAQNLADVFAAWEQEKLLESESARIVIDAKWPGAPDEISLKDVEGLISVNVQRGSFTRGAGSDENGLLRLIALFNFDTIVRRLRLDFSDLTAQGYAFDSVKGQLQFRDGIIYLTEPMIVKSSSSDTQLAGTVDLIEEKMDAEMVVTLPVASNIAVATALVVGLPAALGVYVMSKMFKKQVDRASSLNISVTGQWEDPKVKVKKIFDINAAERRSKKLKNDATDMTDGAEPQNPSKGKTEVSNTDSNVVLAPAAVELAEETTKNTDDNGAVAGEENSPNLR